MATRIIVGLAALASVIEGVMPGAVPQNLLPLALVILGLIYGAMSVDAEDATGFLAVTIAVGAAAGADALNNIPAIGSHWAYGSGIALRANSVPLHAATQFSLAGGVMTPPANCA